MEFKKPEVEFIHIETKQSVFSASSCLDGATGCDLGTYSGQYNNCSGNSYGSADECPTEVSKFVGN